MEFGCPAHQCTYSIVPVRNPTDVILPQDITTLLKANAKKEKPTFSPLSVQTALSKL